MTFFTVKLEPIENCGLLSWLLQTICFTADWHLLGGEGLLIIAVFIGKKW